jgi:hypothetical protein
LPVTSRLTLVTAGDRADTVVELVDGVGDGATATPIWRVTGCDLHVVDVLARLQLVARRHGWSLRIRNPGDDLCALLAFVGLADVLGTATSTSEPQRQSERREQLGVEEMVEGGDPPA